MYRIVADIAADIKADWRPVNYAAKPYLDAMSEMAIPATKEGVRVGRYYEDSATSVILYFLSNAVSWRGETARRIKAELKSIT